MVNKRSARGGRFIVDKTFHGGVERVFDAGLCGLSEDRPFRDVVCGMQSARCEWLGCEHRASHPSAKDAYGWATRRMVFDNKAAPYFVSYS